MFIGPLMSSLRSLSEIWLSFSCRGTRKHSGTPAFKPNIPLIRPINQSVNQSRRPGTHYLHTFLSFISWSNDRNIFPGFSACVRVVFSPNRRTKMMSNFSILNHTCKVASNFMPCLFWQPTSHRVKLINHHYTCSRVLLTTNNKPINQLSDLTVFM